MFKQRTVDIATFCV